jgi:hypothetical protein
LAGCPLRVAFADMSDFVKETVSQRLDEEDEPSRVRALVAAIVIGFGAALLAYRLLRGGGGDDDDDGDDES